ncbi:MAG TPA: acyl carrier protein [Nitrospirota bacterium]|nr:acyl carrier protein [Nitrospirota bacterium]
MKEQERCAQGGENSTKAVTPLQVRKMVTRIISDITKIPEPEITGDKLIRDDLGVDSMRAIESLAVIEKEFSIVIDPDKAFLVATVNDLVKLIEDTCESLKKGAV